MADRYFADEPISGDCVILRGDEAHHLIHVMRALPGMAVTVFDGSGAEFSAVVERVGRTDVEMTVAGRNEVDRELPFELTLAVALPKGDRQNGWSKRPSKWASRGWSPLRTRRVVTQPGRRRIFAVCGERLSRPRSSAAGTA